MNSDHTTNQDSASTGALTLAVQHVRTCNDPNRRQHWTDTTTGVEVHVERGVFLGVQTASCQVYDADDHRRLDSGLLSDPRASHPITDPPCADTSMWVATNVGRTEDLRHSSHDRTGRDVRRG